jgi:glycosyltransferase involved in cell wall biosynthesis
VVTPSFNQAEFLEATIRSVLLQGYPDLEYIVMDGGSTDGSVDIIARYAPWITFWRSGPDSGQSDAINQGFARATGKIIAWLNSDDIYLPRALKTVAELLGGDKYDVLQGATEKVMIHGDSVEHVRISTPTDGSRFEDFPIFTDGRHHSFHFIQPSMFWTREIWQRVGPLDERYHYEMDREWLTRALALGARVTTTEALLARFALHPSSKSHQFQSRFYAERIRMYVRLSRRPEFRSLRCLLAALHPLQRLATTWSAQAASEGDALRMYVWRWAARFLKVAVTLVPGLQRAVRTPVESEGGA